MRVDTTGLNRVDVLYSLYEAALNRVANTGKESALIHIFLIEQEIAKASKDKFMFKTVNFGTNNLLLNVCLEDPNSFDCD